MYTEENMNDREIVRYKARKFFSLVAKSSAGCLIILAILKFPLGISVPLEALQVNVAIVVLSWLIEALIMPTRMEAEQDLEDQKVILRTIERIEELENEKEQ